MSQDKISNSKKIMRKGGDDEKIQHCNYEQYQQYKAVGSLQVKSFCLQNARR